MDHFNIDFTITACLRLEVLARTLESFAKNLQGINLQEQRVFVNIDPLPNDRDMSYYDAMAKVLRHTFGTVHVYLPDEPSFPNAVKWCWSQPETDFFFHLEDDWLLERPYNVRDMAQMLMCDSGLSCVSLRAYHFAKGDSRICLSPGLFRTTHARIMAIRLRSGANPEKQLRPMTAENPMGGAHVGFRGCFTPEEPIIKDIGRAWLEKSGWRKSRPVHFTTWEKQS